MLSKENLSNKYSFPAYSSDSTNNGIVGYTDDPEFICDDKTPVYVTFGDHTRTMNIARKSFSVLDNVKVLLPTYNSDKVLLFIFSVWQKHIPNLGYARHWKIAKDCVLELPQKNDTLDVEFIENYVSELSDLYIAELEAQHIAVINTYLSVCGLQDYALTEEEERVLEDSKIWNWHTLSFESVFNNIKQGKRLKNDDQMPGDMPFVMAGTTNNGVTNYISNAVATFPNNSITIDIFGNTFYRNYSFGAGDDTGIYWNSEKTYSERTMLFFATAMEKSVVGKFSYAKKLRSSQSLNFQMKLPLKGNSPDFKTMDTFISAIQKLVIKDVINFSEAKISAAKSVTGCK